MSLQDHKITEYQQNIKDLPNQVRGQAEWLKAFFDGRGDNEIKDSINGIIDSLLEEENLRADAELTDGVVAITSRSPRADGVVDYCVLFDAPTDFAPTHSYTIDGVTVTLQNLAGKTVVDGWVSGAPVLLAKRGDLAWFVAGGGAGGGVVVRQWEPTAEDDADENYAPGDIWVWQHIRPKNVISQEGFINPDSWVKTLGEGGVFDAERDYGVSLTVKRGTTCKAEAEVPQLLPTVPGHSYYYAYRVGCSHGRASDTLAQFALGNLSAEYTTQTNEIVSAIEIAESSGQSVPASLFGQLAVEFNVTYMVIMTTPIIVDLTETFGPGHEWTKEQCDELFSGYSKQWFEDTLLGGGAAYVCLDATPGAAVWERLVFESDVLLKGGTEAYTPEGPNDPAPKGYVDEAAAAAADGVKAQIVRPNLLVNPSLTVNQRAENTFAGGYTVDMWGLTNASTTLDVTDDEVVMTAGTAAAGFYQKLPNPNDYRGLTLTFSAALKAEGGRAGIQVIYKTTAGSAASFPAVFTTNPDEYEVAASTFQVPDEPMDNIEVRVRSDAVGAKIHIRRGGRPSLKLEVNDASTIENEPPADYGEELAKCRRFLRVYSRSAGNPSSVRSDFATFISSTSLEASINLEPPMRITPTILDVSGMRVRAIDNGTDLAAGAITGVGQSPGHYTLKATGTFTATKLYRFVNSIENGKLIISAEL